MDENSHLAEQRPTTIGRYRIEEELGVGAMGAVYKAFDPLIKRTLAIKTIRLDIPRQSPQYRSFIQRFYHEARISGTLSHPNIVTLFDIGEEGGSPFLAMEFIDGETMGALIERGERFKPEKVISLVSQVAAALDYAHGKGIIHRDIKPSNLMLYEGEKIKVTDFGIAKLVDAEMTQSGTLLGTPSYMSPEQAMGDKLDGRSDIFSLGVCAFEMLSGEQPFPGNNVTSILYKLVHVDPIEPANLEMHGLVPQKWHEVFGKVLAKKPDERYQDAAAFVHDLEYCLGSWFGSLEDTLIAGPGGDDRTATIQRIAAPALPDPPPPDYDPTVATSVPNVTPPPLPRPGAKTLTRPAPAAEEDPATVVLKARPVGDEPTILLNPPPGRRAAAATAPEADSQSATVVVKPAPPRAPAATKAQPPMPSPLSKPDDSSTILLKALPPEGAADEPTVIMNPAPAGAAEITVRTPVVSPVAESTPLGSRPPLPPRTASSPRLSPPPVDTTTVPGSALPPPTARRKGVSPKVLIVGAAAFLLVTLAAVGIVVLRREPAPPPPVVTNPAPQATVAPPSTVVPVAITGTIHVETDPPGAAVTVNGETHGVTPIDLGNVPLGTYEVRIELKGYEPKTETLTLSESARQGELKIVLTKAAPPSGSADFLSTPFGATVTVDGTKLGQTPLTGVKLKAGTRAIAVSREGYEPWTGSLLIQPGQRSRIDAQLRALVRATPPPPPVDVVDTARIYPNTPTDVDTPARRISGSTVSYPDSAPRLRSGDSVSVGVMFVVNEGGEVTDLRVVESGGKVLDEAVTAGVRSWKYAPAVKKGTKVKVLVTFKQTFRAG